MLCTEKLRLDKKTPKSSQVLVGHWTFSTKLAVSSTDCIQGTDNEYSVIRPLFHLPRSFVPIFSAQACML